MKRSTVIIWIVSLVAVAGAIYGLVQLGGGASSTNSSLPLDRAAATDWTRGNAAVAKAVLIEYSDLQCPACASYHPVLKDLLAAEGDNLLLVYRHFPLRQIHQNSDLAARAAEAAGSQGKFWEMHDRLFDEQKTWSNLSDPTETFVTYAKDLGLDEAKFRSDLNSSAVRARVNEDLASGQAARVQGTPTFFLNGQKIQNPDNLNAFKQLVDDAIAQRPVSQSGTDAKVHEHFDLRVVVDGQAIDFSQDRFQSTEAKELNPDIHFHDGNGQVVHVHKAAQTLNDLFHSFDMDLGRDCLKLDATTTKCATGANKLRLYVNGQEQTEAGGYAVHDLDRVVILYGELSDATVQRELKAVSDLACIYSETCPERGKPPTENCVGGLGTNCD